MSRHSSFDESSKGAVKKEMTTDKKDPATASVASNVSNFLQRMYDPSITRFLESRMPPMSQDLLRVPWTLCNEKEVDVKTNSDDKSFAVYPSFTYLDLRKIQNEQWATERLKEGIRLAKENKLEKAEACYKEGIDLAPTHAELFVAYGALCANLGRIQEAIRKLQHALELDANVANAQNFLDTIRKQQAPTRQAGSVTRSETALKDALMEKAFFQERTKGLNPNDDKYPLVYEEKDDTDMEERHRKKDSKRRRDRHAKSRSRKKRKRRKRSSSTSDESSRHRGRRRRHGRASSEETSEESSRRRHRRRNSRRHESSNVSSDSSRDREHRKARRREGRGRKRHKKSREQSPSRASVSEVASHAKSEAPSRVSSFPAGEEKKSA
jgi:tetratricopeptide (TPR) repeat protein